jgi:PKD domain
MNPHPRDSDAIMAFTLDLSKNLLLLLAAITALFSVSSLTMLTQEVFAVPDKFGIDELYATADNGPVWFLNNEQPEADDNFLLTSAENIVLEEEDSDVFALDAETGTPKHGVRLHADSPEGEWKNVEMTGYFKLHQGNDQFTLIGRQGPTYNDNGGCGAYGYYGMLSANGDAYFKKKLFHFGGYTGRTAVQGSVVDNLNERWVGIKLVAYDLEDDEVKLELWVDDGDETNNWKKVTEYVDDGNWQVSGNDCDRSSDDIIEEGTRGGFRVDDSQFEFKKLSIREIAEGAEAADEEAADDGGGGEAAEAADEEAAYDGGGGEAAEAAEAADEEAAYDGGGGEAAEAAEAADEEAADDVGPTDLLTVEIISNGMEGAAPATIKFDTLITGGTGPYTVSWDFGDGSEGSDEQTVLHTYNEAGIYNVVLTVTDSEDQTASDNVEVTVEEAPTEGG